MITGLYAGILGIGYVFLSYRVANLRRKLKVGLGDGGEKSLAKAIRVHGNFSEYTPFILLLLLLVELNPGIMHEHLNYHHMLIHGHGVILVFARAYHAYGITQHSGVSTGRLVGTAFTWLLIFSLSVISISSFAI